MKLQEIKLSTTRSFANVVDDESPEEYKIERDNRKMNIKNLSEEFQTNFGNKGQKFSIKAR